MSEPPRQRELLDWPQEGIPVVFRRQPAEYEIVPPERYAEWEAQVLDSVKLTLKAGSGAGYLPTLSWCGPGETNACDSDTIPSR
jgi:hypothetical protein